VLCQSYLKQFEQLPRHAGVVLADFQDRDNLELTDDVPLRSPDIAFRFFEASFPVAWSIHTA
jgi:hypothetical protein